MNSNAITKIAVTLVCVIVAIWLTLDLFTSNSNVIARICGYLTAASFLAGLLSPKGAFYMTVGMSGYLDFFKRFMVLDSNVDKFDLYLVLGMAPAAVAGIAGNLLYRTAMGQIKPVAGIPRLAAFTVLAMGAFFAAMMLGSGSKFRAIGDSINGIVYFSLLFIVPILFPTPADLRLMLKRMLIIFVPSVIYMLVHHYRKMVMNIEPPVFWWELDYLKSGLTIEVRQLSERSFRPFGTMNSAANASVVFAVLFGLLLSGIWGYRANSPHQRKRAAFIRFFWALVVAFAGYATLSRAGWLVGLLSIPVAWSFRSRMMTMCSYAVGFVSTSVMIVFSGYILKTKLLNEISADLFDQQRTDLWAQTTNISTFNDRLEGFAQWSNPKLWTPFGYLIKGSSGKRFVEEFGYHDLFTGLILKFGFVGFSLCIAGALWVLFQLHSFVLRQPPGLSKSISSICLALFLLITATAFANTAVFITYPVNFFVALLPAVIVSLIFHEKQQLIDQRQLARGKGEEEAAGLQPAQPFRPGRPERTMPVPARA